MRYNNYTYTNTTRDRRRTQVWTDIGKEELEGEPAERGGEEAKVEDEIHGKLCKTEGITEREKFWRPTFLRTFRTPCVETWLAQAEEEEFRWLKSDEKCLFWAVGRVVEAQARGIAVGGVGVRTGTGSAPARGGCGGDSASAR